MADHQHVKEEKSAWPDKTWILGHRPDGDQMIMIRDGTPQPLHLGEDYGFVGNVITMSSQPTEGVKHFLYYSFSGDFDGTPITSGITFYPNADPETTSVDGFVGRGVVEGWAAKRGAAAGTLVYDGDEVDDPGKDIRVTIRTAAAGDPAGTWDYWERGILLFDTSSLPDGAIIISAQLVLTLRANPVVVLNSYTVLGITLVGSTPASNVGLVVGDYSALGTTALSNTKLMTGLVLGDTVTFTLNAAGLAAISKTGITKFGLLCEEDRANTEPTPWPGYTTVSAGAHFRSAETLGGVGTPRLEVVYTL